MAQFGTKLELTWIGKDVRPRLEPRILIEDTDLSYHAEHKVTDADIFDNRLIFGDNLLGLKALEHDLAGTIKCICIDPPYNTGAAFTHYDDGVEHSVWLSLMWERVWIMRRLLSDDGSIWIFVDDNEVHYLKVMLDEIFGRANFIANVIWQKKYAPANDAKWLSESHDHVLVYAKNKDIWRPNKLIRTEDSARAYKNPDNDPRGPWKSGDYTCNKTVDERPNLYYPIKHPATGAEVWPKRTAVWRYSREAHQLNEAENRIWWGKDSQNSVPAYKRFLSEVREGRVAQTVWQWDDVGHTQDGKKEQLLLVPDEPFPTPKPEKLISRILELASTAGDLVLDSFAGSGTTGAVAHKMGRRWIMIELGEHCHTHIIPRMKKVVDGTDQGGISKAVEWKGGGGFRYYKLATSLLEKDRWGNWVISKQYNAAMLAEAMCKLNGFRYEPSETVFWQQGRSSETDFIYTTTQALGREVFAHLCEEVGPERTLLVCCMKYDVDPNEFANLTIKKIPNAVLGKCEFGHDDYSLEIANLPQRSPEDAAAVVNNGRKRSGYVEPAGMGSLFGENGGEA